MQRYSITRNLQQISSLGIAQLLMILTQTIVTSDDIYTCFLVKEKYKTRRVPMFMVFTQGQIHCIVLRNEHGLYNQANAFVRLALLWHCSNRR